MHDADAGSSPWGSVERLQALANLLCIAGGEPALLDALQPAVHGWLTLGASGGTHDPDMRQRHLILGMLPFIVLPILSISGSALIANTMIQFCASYLHIIVLMRLTQACHDCRTLPDICMYFTISRVSASMSRCVCRCSGCVQCLPDSHGCQSSFTWLPEDSL